MVAQLVKKGHKVGVETNAGLPAQLPDALYSAAGAEILPDGQSCYRQADIILKVRAPHESELPLLKPDSVVIGTLGPLSDPEVARQLAGAKVTSFSLDLMPRITRAQSMDVLSSMSTVSGYRAVLTANLLVERFFPMLMTAAGTIAPAKVLILGAGVAGLQAIATAKRLGAVVQAFDVRPASREQVESLGASFLSLPVDNAEAQGGYARAMGADEEARERELLAEPVQKSDVVIATALVPGRRAPILVDEAMVRSMHTGAVIVDLAAETGGNCALTRPGEVHVTEGGVIIDGSLNLPSNMPSPASQLYARNVVTFLNHLFTTWSKDAATAAELGPVPEDDEILIATRLTAKGEVTHAPTRDKLSVAK
jgi:NAD(P) transhydrogenase subunit alpha